MGYWNYRVFKKVWPSGDVELSIRETHYPDGADPAQPTLQGLGYSASPFSPGGETLDELEDDLKKMLEALQKPILEPQE